MPARKPVSALAVMEKAWIDAGASLMDAIRMMDDNDLGAVVILKDTTPVGILTERDIVRLLFESVDLEGPAIDYTPGSVISVNESRSITYALDLMMENNFRRLVVLDDNGKFLGIVTQVILLKSVESDFYRATLRVEHLKEEIRELVSVTSEDSVQQALTEMVQNRISAIPVLKGRSPVGIITERDILKLARKGVDFVDPVKKYMSSPVTCVGYETTLADVVTTLASRGIKRVVVTDPEGQAAGVLTNRDVLKHIEEDYSEYLERKLAHSKEIMNLLPEMMLEIVDTGKEQLIVWANQKALDRYGSEIVDSPITRLVPPMKWTETYEDLVRTRKVEEVRFRREGFVFEFSGFHVDLERAGMKGRIQLIMRDITQEVMLATTDPLTGIYNRRHMNEAIDKEVQRCRRKGGGFAIGLVDLDDFKRINDTYGHQTGDSLLKTIAARIMLILREYDQVGRYGGEEFLIITPEVDPERAVRVLDRVRADLEKHRFMVAPHEDTVITVSIGMAFYDSDGLSREELIAVADERLYRAKAEGKNRIVSSLS